VRPEIISIRVINSRPAIKNCSIASYDTVLEVFTGSCGALTSVDCNDDCGFSIPSCVTFTATSGVTYIIRVTSFVPGGGTLVLSCTNPPTCTLMCPADITTSTGAGNTQCGKTVTFTPTTAGGGCGTVTCAPASGSFFPVGTTTVNCSAGSQSCSFTVTVTDNTEPTLMLKPNIALWPPNHMYRTVTMSQMVQSVSDNCSSLSLNDVVIEKVTSDEPDNVKGGGDGETINDIVIAADCKSVQLRAERDGTKNGRVYVVTLRVRDASGNTTRQDFKVSVPHDQSGAPAVQDAAAQTKTSNCL